MKKRFFFINTISMALGTSLLTAILIAQNTQPNAEPETSGNNPQNVTVTENSTDTPSEADQDNIPAEFKNVGRDLPPSKRRLLQNWLLKLQYEKANTRMRSAREIYWFQDKESIPYLVTALNDPYWGVRLSAVRALVYIGETEYEQEKLLPPNYTTVRALRESLLGKEMKEEDKGELLLKAEEPISEAKTYDIIVELKRAYYREAQYRQDPMVMEEIRTALVTLEQKKQNAEQNSATQANP